MDNQLVAPIPFTKRQAFWASPEGAEVKARIAEKARRRWQDSAVREHHHKVLQAAWTPEMRSAAAKRAKADPERLKRARWHHTEESRRKQAAALRRSWQDPEVRARRLAAITSETRHKLSEAQSRVWARMDREERDHRTGAMRKRVMGGQYISVLEALVCTALNAVDVDYQIHAVIGPYVADFLVRVASLVIEADGSYWHNREGAPDHDAVRDAYMVEHGYRVVRIPESATQAEIEAILREELGPHAAHPTGRA